MGGGGHIYDWSFVVREALTQAIISIPLSFRSVIHLSSYTDCHPELTRVISETQTLRPVVILGLREWVSGQAQFGEPCLFGNGRLRRVPGTWVM